MEKERKTTTTFNSAFVASAFGRCCFLFFERFIHHPIFHFGFLLLSANTVDGFHRAQWTSSESKYKRYMILDTCLDTCCLWFIKYDRCAIHVCHISVVFFSAVRSFHLNSSHESTISFAKSAFFRATVFDIRSSSQQQQRQQQQPWQH